MLLFNCDSEIYWKWLFPFLSVERRCRFLSLWGCSLHLELETGLKWVYGVAEIIHKMLNLGMCECFCGKRFLPLRNLPQFPPLTQRGVWPQKDNQHCCWAGILLPEHQSRHFCSKSKGSFESRCRNGISMVLLVIINNKHIVFKHFNTNNAFKENSTVIRSLLSIFTQLKTTVILC